MDRRPGQRCAQLDWHRGLLQPVELRADVWFPYRDLAAYTHSAGGHPCAASAHSWHRASLCTNHQRGTCARNALEWPRSYKVPDDSCNTTSPCLRPDQLLSRVALDAL